MAIKLMLIPCSASIKSKKPTSRQKIRKAHFARKELESAGNDSFRRMTRLSAQALEPITLDLGFAPRITKQRRVLLDDIETEEEERDIEDESTKQRRAYGTLPKLGIEGESDLVLQGARAHSIRRCPLSVGLPQLGERLR